MNAAILLTEIVLSLYNAKCMVSVSLNQCYGSISLVMVISKLHNCLSCYLLLYMIQYNITYKVITSKGSSLNIKG